MNCGFGRGNGKEGFCAIGGVKKETAGFVNRQCGERRRLGSQRLSQVCELT